METSYQKIFSRYRGKITALNYLSLSKDDINTMEVEYLHSSISNPRIRNKFASLKLDDIIQTITFELRNPVDVEWDEEFVIEVLSHSMVISWLQPQVDSVVNTAPMIGGKEEKKILDNHKQTIARLSQLKTELQKMIRDHGYLNNSYVRGK